MHTWIRTGLLALLAWAWASAAAAFAQGAAPIAIAEDFKVGYQYHVNCRVHIKGALLLPADKGGTPSRIEVKGKSVIKYDERVLELKAGEVQRTVRFYDLMTFERQAGKDDQGGSLRRQARRLVILRKNQFEVPFCPHGPLLWEEIDMVRTDVFTPALKGLLPSQPVRPGDSWAADRSAVQELTDLESIAKGGLTCRFKQVETVKGRPFARIAFQGTITGIGEDGPGLHEIEGALLFDLTANHLSYLSMQGTQYPLDKSGNKTGGQIAGTFVLTREPAPHAEELSDAALKGLKLVPDEENTLLWFVSPEVGVSFVYPRHWHIGGVNGQRRQVGLDEKRGSGVLVTVDALQNAPTIATLQQEVQNNLQKQQAKINKIERPRQLDGAIDTFGVAAEIAGKRVYLQYFVVRQASSYAVVTANLQTQDMVALQKDVERLVRSLVVRAPAK